MSVMTAQQRERKAKPIDTSSKPFRRDQPKGGGRGGRTSAGGRGDGGRGGGGRGSGRRADEDEGQRSSKGARRS